MPVPGNHEVEFGNGPQGYTSYLTRYTLPRNGIPGFEGRWYSFRAGSVLFVSLSADDVVYQDGAAFVAGPAALTPAPSTGNPPIPAGTSLYVRGYSGIREEWLPLFDRYEVDLVLCGHDHDYERSFPVRGFDAGAGTDAATGAPADTRRPHPVTTVDSGVFDTSQGTVHLVLGCGGTGANLDAYGADTADGAIRAKVFTRPNRPVMTGTPGVYARAAADAVEDAPWSARRDTSTGYGTGFD